MKQPSSQSQPYFIFIGEAHGDFSYVSLTNELLKSCQEKGLTVAVYSELPHEEKSGFIKGDKSANKEEIVDAVFKNAAFKAIHSDDERKKLIGRVYGEYDGKKGFSAVFEDRKEAMNPSTRKVIEANLGSLEKSVVDSKSHQDFIKCAGSTNVHLLLSPDIADEMAKQVRINQQSSKSDVVIVWTGGRHAPNIAKRLVDDKKEKIILSNAIPDKEIDQSYFPNLRLSRFEIDSATKIPKIPAEIEEGLSELQKSKKSALEQESKGKQKSWVERMRSDKTQGKSKGGSNKL